MHEYEEVPQSEGAGGLAESFFALGMVAVGAGAGLAFYGVYFLWGAISLSSSQGAAFLIFPALFAGALSMMCIVPGVSFVLVACLALRHRQWNLKHLVIVGAACAFVGLPASCLIMSFLLR